MQSVDDTGFPVYYGAVAVKGEDFVIGELGHGTCEGLGGLKCMFRTAVVWYNIDFKADVLASYFKCMEPYGRRFQPFK